MYFFLIDIAWGLQKLGIILENKLPPLMKFVKAVTIIFEMQFPCFLEAH